MNSALNAPMSKGTVKETSLEAYFELTKNAELAALVERIRQTEDKDERRKLKTNLPIRCPHYFRFQDNHRQQASIIPEAFTFQTCVDIDNEADVEPGLSRAYIINQEEGLWKGRLLHVERSASGKIHLDIRIPVGMTIEEAQKAYTQALGVTYDEKCITPERMIYITDAASQLYTSDDWYAPLSDDELTLRRKAYADRGLDVDGRPIPSSAVSQAATQPSPTQAEIVRIYPSAYENIPYFMIVEELTKLMGGAPTHGNRNDFIYNMACHLRHICDNDPKWLCQVIPNFGEDQARVDQTIQNAVKYSKGVNTPPLLNMAINECRRSLSGDNGTTVQPPMPATLPQPLRLLVSKAPRGYHPAILTAVFPALATHMGGVKLAYYNNTFMEATLMNNVVADSSSGKSCIKMPVKSIMKPFAESDRENRLREEEWAEKNNAKGANKDKTERPKDILVRDVYNDMTPQGLLIRLKAAELAGNKAIFSMMPEMEMLNKAAGGKKSDITEIVRRNFDTEEMGQERFGAMSCHGGATLRMNLVVSTTPTTAKQYYKGQFANGTFSRMNISTIVDEDVEDFPMFGTYDERFDKALKPYLDRLDKTEGTIACKQAKDLAKRCVKIIYDRSALMDSKAYSAIGFRSVEIMFRKACLLYVMNGRKWSNAIEEFCLWSFEYDMWCKFSIFGEQAAKEFGDVETTTGHRGPQNHLDQLSDNFTWDQVADLRRMNKKFDNAGTTKLINVWRYRGYIEPISDDPKCRTYRKTEAYLKRKAA